MLIAIFSLHFYRRFFYLYKWYIYNILLFKERARARIYKVWGKIFAYIRKKYYLCTSFFKDKTHPRYAELRSRWNAQFKNGGDAFLNEGKSDKVVYGMFPVFVRMVIMKEKKGEMGTTKQA